MGSLEIWHVCAGFPDYEVSSLGRVRRLTACSHTKAGFFLKPYRMNSGYWTVTLWRGGVGKSVLIHRLIATAFHGAAPTPKHEVAHFDGDRSNNVASNLRWATRAENCADKKRHGTYHYGERHPASKLKASDVQQIRALIKSGVGCAPISRQFGVSQAAIHDIANGRNWAWLPETGDTI